MRRIAFLIPAALLLVLPAGAGAAKGFDLGVAAGEIKSKSAVLWAHAKGKSKVKLEVNDSKNFKDPEQVRTITPSKSNDLTVQSKVSGLDAATTYYYRFRQGNKKSKTGKFETAPKSSKSATIEFAYSGDTDGTPAAGQKNPFFGSFLTFKAMRKEKNDFNFHFGDTIYSDSDIAGTPKALTVQQKWAKYKQNLGQSNLTKLRSAAGFYSHWDDHEFINDFSRTENGQAIYDAGVKAFRNYAPVTYSSSDGLYRTFRWGKNLEIFMLDERSFRDAKASANGVCNNPATGQPDLAPTAPSDKRALFSLLIPSLSNPPSAACLNTINDPNRTFLGSRQFSTFTSAIARSDAKFKVVMNETPIQQFYGLPYDRWEGYASERIRLLQALQNSGVKNVVFLTTDTHANFNNTVRFRTLTGDSAPGNAPATIPGETGRFEYITGPVATNTFWKEIDSVTGRQGNGKLLSQAFFKLPPQSGVGMLCAQGDVFSYAEVKVSSSAVTITPKTETGQPVKDADGTTNCGPYTINAQ